jgi:hypothetical protein
MNKDGNVVWVIGVLLNKTKKNDHRIRARKTKKEKQQEQPLEKEKNKINWRENIMDIIQIT